MTPSLWCQYILFTSQKTAIMQPTVQSSTRTQWVLDPAHSELAFRVRHLMISSVKGVFRKFIATIDGDDFSRFPLRAVIQADSVDTNDSARDTHLKSADFFDTGNHPEMVFESSAINKTAGDHYVLQGNLTIRGVSRPVSLYVEYGGTGVDPWGNEKAAFSVTGTLCRSDWGLNWNAALEAGGVLVSDEVRIVADIQLVKKGVE
jgi:polyisoprenoid-binding protein YceI